jgi:hypothetical protein
LKLLKLKLYFLFSNFSVELRRRVFIGVLEFHEKSWPNMWSQRSSWITRNKQRFQVTSHIRCSLSFSQFGFVPSHVISSSSSPNSYNDDMEVRLITIILFQKCIGRK